MVDYNFKSFKLKELASLFKKAFWLYYQSLITFEIALSFCSQCNLHQNFSPINIINYELTGAMLKVSIKNNDSSVTIFKAFSYVPTLGSALTPVPVSVILFPKNKLFKKFMETHLVVQGQLLALALAPALAAFEPQK